MNPTAVLINSHPFTTARSVLDMILLFVGLLPQEKYRLLLQDRERGSEPDTDDHKRRRQNQEEAGPNEWPAGYIEGEPADDPVAGLGETQGDQGTYQAE
jgi:hypothetical protein